MSHFNNESQSAYRHMVKFSERELRQLRKQKNLWLTGALVALVAWMYLVVATIPLGALASLATFVMIGPLVVVGTIGGKVRHKYLPQAEAANFVKTWRQFFQEWMVDEAAVQHGVPLLTVNVTMSNKSPGMLRVEVLHFEPMYERMVFEFGADFVGGYSDADPKEVFPILRDAISNATMAGVRAKELEVHFGSYNIPAVSAQTREAMSLRGDD